MAVKAEDGSTTTTLPLPPRLSASSSPPTVGTLLTRASAGAGARECSSSPRSLLSRILHRGRGGGGGGFGCRLRLFPRYCASGAAAAAREDVAAAKAEVRVEPREAAAPKVVAAQPALRESPRSSLGKKATVAEDALPASLGLGASLVLLLSKSAAELSRMAELRTQMERLMLDVRADVQSCNGRPSGSRDHVDSASVVKGPIVVGAGDEERAFSHSDGSRTTAPVSHGTSENAGNPDMDRMEAELEAELSLLQQASSHEEFASPRRDREELETEAKKSSASSRSHSVICSGSDDGGVDDDDGSTGDDGDGSQDCNGKEEEEEEYGRDDDESNAKSPPHGGVSARELERRLHELLQSRHEARIAELESALERARRKLRETEREASRWRDTAKLATRFTDESRLR